MSNIEVKLAPLEKKTAIQNMMQLYVHDFSELWSETSRGELGDDGRFSDYPLDAYWFEAENIPLLLTTDDRLVGFALLNATSHSGQPVDHNMAEFFVARKHRRNGIGTAAARIIFNRFSGIWETAVARRNSGALAFWRNAIANYPAVSDAEELNVTTDSWDGPILRFRM